MDLLSWALHFSQWSTNIAELYHQKLPEVILVILPGVACTYFIVGGGGFMAPTLRVRGGVWSNGCTTWHERGVDDYARHMCKAHVAEKICISLYS